MAILDRTGVLNTNPDKYVRSVDTNGFCAIAKIKPETAANWRTKKQNKGPRYHKLGKRVIYLMADIEEWLAGQVVETADSR